MASYFYEDDDTESNQSWYASDNEEFDEENDFVYQPEEVSLTKFNIVLCEKYNIASHGQADEQITNNYLTYVRFKELNMDFVNLFRVNSNTLQLEISECIYLPSDHCISIIKTIWLKLIQRNWKRIMNERKLCIYRRGNPNALKYKEIHGNWPQNCAIYPGIKGMLSNLSRTTSRCASA